MNPKRLLLASIFTVTMMSAAVAHASEDRTELFSADFENTSSVTDAGLWTWSERDSGKFEIIQESSGNHAAKITPSSDQNQEYSNQIGKNFDTPYTSGIITVKYRIKNGGDRYDGFVLRSTVNGENTDVYAPSFYWGRCGVGRTDDLFGAYRYPIAVGDVGSMWASTDAWATENTWYSVENVLDLDKDVLKVTVYKPNGVKLGRTAEYTYTGNCAAFYVESKRPGAAGTETLFDDLKIEYFENKVRINAEPWEHFDIFKGGETQKYTVKLENHTDGPQDISLCAEAVNGMGISVYKQEFDALTVYPGDYNQSQRVEMDLKQYGIFTLRLSAKYWESGEERTVTTEFPFTVINDSDTVNPRIGINTHLPYFGAREYYLARHAARAGFGIVREEIRWSALEQNRGQYKTEDEQLLKAANAVAENSMDQLMILGYSNALYCESESVVPTSDEQIEAFKKYCTNVAAMCKGKVKYYEVWNEYNYDAHNKYYTGVDVYVKLLRAAHEAVKAVDPSAVIVGVCAGGNDPENGFKFMREVFNAGGLQYMDAVSFHPYQWNREHDMQRFSDDIWTVRNMLKQYSKPSLPIIVTEMGWSSGNSEHCVSELQQAISSVEMYVTAMQTGQCDKVLLYALVNDGVTDTREQNFGMLRGQFDDHPFEAKPVYVAIAGMNKLIGNADYVDTKNIGNTVIHRFRKSNGEWAAIAWSTQGSEQIRLKCGSGVVSLCDLYSNVFTSNARADGLHCVTTSWQPCYITGDISTLEDAGTASGAAESFFAADFNGGSCPEGMWIWDQNGGYVDFPDSGIHGKSARLNSNGNRDIQLGISNVNYNSGVVTVSYRIKPGKGKINGLILRSSSAFGNHDVHAPYFYRGGARVGIGIDDGRERQLQYGYSGSTNLIEDKWYTVVDVLDLDNNKLTVNVYDDEWNRECEPVTYPYRRDLTNIFFSSYDELEGVSSNPTLIDDVIVTHSGTKVEYNNDFSRDINGINLYGNGVKQENGVLIINPNQNEQSGVYRTVESKTAGLLGIDVDIIPGNADDTKLIVKDSNNAELLVSFYGDSVFIGSGDDRWNYMAGRFVKGRLYKLRLLIDLDADMIDAAVIDTENGSISRLKRKYSLADISQVELAVGAWISWGSSKFDNLNITAHPARLPLFSIENTMRTLTLGNSSATGIKTVLANVGETDESINKLSFKVTSGGITNIFETDDSSTVITLAPEASAAYALVIDGIADENARFTVNVE